MSAFSPISLANHNLGRNKIRTFLTIVAIMVGAFTLTLCSAIRTGMTRFVAEQTANLGGEDYMIILPEANRPVLEGYLSNSNNLIEFNSYSGVKALSPAELTVLKSLDGIDQENFYTPKVLFNVIAYISNSATHKKYNFSYVTVSDDNRDIAMSVGNLPKSGTNAHEITLQHGMPETLGFKSDEEALGQSVQITYQNPQTLKFQTFVAKVVGVTSADVVTLSQPIISEALENHIVDFYTAHLPNYKKGQAYYVKTRINTSVISMAEMKKILTEKGYYCITVEDMLGSTYGFFQAVMVILQIFGVLTLLVAALGVVNTLLMSVDERTREIGLDKALGMSSIRIFCGFSMEAILMGFWGSIFGVAVSLLVGRYVNSIVHATGGFLEMFPTFQLCQFTLNDILWIVLGVIIVSLIAGTIPAARAANKSPIEALRYE